ncbi:AbrB family transcriptional regulator [Ruegeria profundi]|uniref:AbrB family transcriptional regulator n=1 Tax=Ruegeria profundi TaxID=1685378 RepID=UPI001CD3906C|nr:AbrB family transcriptional regulator [Ruegeria profundi]MCA0930674.1 AbrB family transcriptional regulator [Ruegeria profundi]
MISKDLRLTTRTLAIGAVGAAVAALAGLPAAPLLGAAMATATTAWSGARLAVDTKLRNAGFLVIGLSLGSGIDSSAVTQLESISISLSLLCASVLVTLWLNRWMLMRLFTMPADTALLSSAPGTMSVALSIAVDGRGDPATVLVMQSMRLLGLACVLPLLFYVFGTSYTVAYPQGNLGFGALVGLASVGLAVSLALARLGMPAAFLVGGLVVSAAAHLLSFVEGYPPAALLTAGLCVTGAAIGSRFSNMPLASILQLGWPTTAIVTVAAGVSAAFAGVVAVLIDVPMSQAWIAFAPGGVEAMAAIGFALGFDPTFVALHHFARIAILSVLLPLYLR